MSNSQKPDVEDLANKLFPEIGAEEFSESILSIPPEQRRLHTETYDFSIATVVDYVEKRNIFVPDYQRRYVWSQAQASRLIESLIIQCPIPVIYLNQERDERLSVIDGNQRITSTVQFIRNQFELRGLTAYPELEGLRFHQLDARIQRHITNRTLRCIVIMKDTHPQVKFDVFERLNTGATKLTAQELRHGLYHGEFMKLVDTLAKGKEWKDLLGLKSDKRMRSEEFIIRFFALTFNFENYSKPLSGFLNDFCERHRDLTTPESAKFGETMAATVSAARALYGDLAFKQFDSQLEPISPLNAALFDAEMVSLSRFPGAVEFDGAKKRAYLTSLSQLLATEKMQKAITRATSDESVVSYRVNALSDLLRKFA